VESIDRRDECFRETPRPERVDGLLIISLPPMDEDVDRFLKAEVPTVLIDARHPLLHRLTIDDVEGGRQATDHLIQLGHRKIAFVGDFLESPFGFASSRERFEGYYHALEMSDIPFQPGYLKQGDHSQLTARKMTMELLSAPNPPTAIFAASDTQAIGVLAAARDMGIPVPGKLSVIGYDDIEVAEYLHLTTMRQPSFELGIEGAQLLMDIITQPDTPVREISFQTELITRSTTAPTCRD
jgi:DNA-binding LacI/PurR family transcriptional regulator